MIFSYQRVKRVMVFPCRILEGKSRDCVCLHIYNVRLMINVNNCQMVAGKKNSFHREATALRQYLGKLVNKNYNFGKVSMVVFRLK